MQSSSVTWPGTLDTLVDRVAGAIPGHVVFIQRERGAESASLTAEALPDRLRMLLFLVNGRRRMSEYRDLLPRYRNLDDAFKLLAHRGFIERRTDASPH